MKKVLASFLLIFILGVYYGLPDEISAGQVSAAAFKNAKVGEVLVWYEGEDKPVKYKYQDNNDAAIALAAFASNEAVRQAQPNYIYRAAALPNDPLLEQQTHLELIAAKQAWDIQSNAADVVIAVIDSGVDITHPDLKNNIWRNSAEIVNGADDDGNGFIDDINGWDFLENTADVAPKFPDYASENSIGVQHGTMVSGIIAAQGDNNLGVAGVAWGAQIMPLRVLNAFGTGTSETVTQALDYALELKVDVINLSLVGAEYDPLVVNLLEEAYEQGVVVVAAAGNNGANLNAVETFPVCYNDFGKATVIGVGAIDGDFLRPEFSNYGSDCVDIAAPGIEIFSTRLIRPDFESQEQYDAIFSGTSFAAPQVTGVVALMKQMNPNLKSDEILNILRDGGRDISVLNAASDGFIYALDAYNSLSLVTREQESEDVISLATQFVAYPLSAYRGSAYIYQLPGPLAVSPFILDGEAFDNGMGIVKLSDFTGLVYEMNSKKIFAINFVTEQYSPLLTIDEADEQTIGSVVIGNVDADLQNEIVVASGLESLPLISVYDTSGHLKSRFAPFNTSINGGLSVALLDRGGDGIKEIAVVPTSETDGHIKIFEYTGLLLDEWLAYSHFGGGATLSTADINGDGMIELLVGPGATGGPHVKAFSGAGELVLEFFGGDVIDGGGADVHYYDLDNDGQEEFVLSFKTTHTPVIRIYSPNGEFISEMGVLDGQYEGGVGIYPL